MRRPSTTATLTVAAAILATGALSACGSDDDGDTAQPATTTTSTSTGTGDAVDPAISETATVDSGRTVIEVTMTGGKVDPAPDVVEVDEGAKVRVIVNRDTDGEIHVHGFGDKHVDAKAGIPAQLDFVADQQGSYEVEAHDPDRLLFTLQVQ